ncbi:MAG: BCCT family transporter [Glaciecola sp.]|nr:BCCT family transporter [Glaciecola sp.]MDG1468641.1 BCCT family transporter [Glaciecola sp.]MDG1923271.1 BCCT family transporter [Glaciecola sp.]
MIKVSKNSFNANKLNRGVFFSASAVIFMLVAITVMFPTEMEALFSDVQKTLIDTAGWFYVLSVAGILVAVVYLCVSRHGHIKLGPDHAQADYSQLTWLAMLFSAGMGIGLMFFGVAEPVMHYVAPPTADPYSIEATREALKMTFFHWGLHGWAIYAVVALILAYFSFRHNLPLTLRSAFHPLIGDKIYTWRGDIIDSFAVISTIFGVTTSLGFGVMQINSGLNYLFGIEVSQTVQLSIITFIICLALVSVCSGLDKGIKRLSQLNMIMAVALLLFVLVAGPSLFLLQALVQNTGAYLSDIVHNTFNLFAYQKTDWLGGWTIFYWAWWLSWSPFVGMFIARISRGRTIREFLIGVLLIPSGFTFAWMTIFGNSAIDLIHVQGMTDLADAVAADSSIALFAFLEHLPFSQIISFIGLVMVIIFFVTSCDSGAMVVDMLASHGENNTPLWQRFYWTVGIGVVATILLLNGGLAALQTMSIVSALPFTVVLIIAIYGMFTALSIESTKQQSMNVAVMQSPSIKSDDWRQRLAIIVNFPSKSKVLQFLAHNVGPALTKVANELNNNQIATDVLLDDDRIILTVSHVDQPDFIYAVRARTHIQPDLLEDASDQDEEQMYYRAEVHLAEGGQDYDIMSWPETAIINDVVEQYQKHVHFLHLLK